MTVNDAVHEQRDQLRKFVHSWDSMPAILCDLKLDVLEANSAAAALSPAFSPGENLVRFAFLSQDRMPEHKNWQAMSEAVAALLRDSMDEHDSDRTFDRILGELSAKSQQFAEAWASRDLTAQTSGPIAFPTANGETRMVYNLLKVPGAEGDSLLIFTPVDDERPAASLSLGLLNAGSGTA